MSKHFHSESWFGTVEREPRQSTIRSMKLVLHLVNMLFRQPFFSKISTYVLHCNILFECFSISLRWKVCLTKTFYLDNIQHFFENKYLANNFDRFSLFALKILDVEILRVTPTLAGAFCAESLHTFSEKENPYYGIAGFLKYLKS